MQGGIQCAKGDERSHRQYHRCPGSHHVVAGTRRFSEGFFFVHMFVHITDGGAQAAIEQMSKNLALEWAEFGIRVNCVAPYVL